MMLSETTLWLLIALALLAPPLGAIALRLLRSRIGDGGVAIGASALLIVAAVSLLIISRSPLPPVRVGDLTLLPARALASPETLEDGIMPVLPVVTVVAPPTLTPRPTPAPTATPTPEPTATPAPTATPTPEPTATPAPTATPTPEPTATPAPTATPTPEPTAAGPRRYTVQSGDTLRAIAERFGVTIEAILQANNLTPAQGDNLRVGQELTIP